VSARHFRRSQIPGGWQGLGAEATRNLQVSGFLGGATEGMGARFFAPAADARVGEGFQARRQRGGRHEARVPLLRLPGLVLFLSGIDLDKSYPSVTGRFSFFFAGECGLPLLCGLSASPPFHEKQKPVSTLLPSTFLCRKIALPVAAAGFPQGEPRSGSLKMDIGNHKPPAFLGARAATGEIANVGKLADWHCWRPYNFCHYRRAQRRMTIRAQDEMVEKDDFCGVYGVHLGPKLPKINASSGEIANGGKLASWHCWRPYNFCHYRRAQRRMTIRAQDEMVEKDDFVGVLGCWGARWPKMHKINASKGMNNQGPIAPIRLGGLGRLPFGFSSPGHPRQLSAGKRRR
jgi:hypothetical protein